VPTATTGDTQHEPLRRWQASDVTDPEPIDWDELRRCATEIAGRGYAPYSHVRVGAAGLTVSGRIVIGCNVENASSGLGICAEVNLAGHLVASGEHRLRAVVVVTGDGRSLSPCGRCRQVLHEFGGEELLVDWPGGPRRLGDLLPDAFGPSDVAGRTEC
jgi:cytidine deaminase